MRAPEVVETEAGSGACARASELKRVALIVEGAGGVVLGGVLMYAMYPDSSWMIGLPFAVFGLYPLYVAIWRPEAMNSLLLSTIVDLLR